MHSLQGKRTNITAAFLLLALNLVYVANGSINTYTLDGQASFVDPHIVPLRERVKRDLVLTRTAVASATASATATATTNVPVTNGSVSTTTAPTTAVVTRIPLLGQNGTGILKVNITSPRVSDPIFPDDNITTDVFNETPEKMRAEQNITVLKYDNHSFYNSSFINNLTYFNEYWANITKPRADVHAVLSNSHRRATTIRLTFDFPFYGNGIRNITVATGGFLYTGEHVHNWLAATQYIAPLMANFDTTLTNDSYVKMYDDGEKFTAFWENVTLQEDLTKKFTFAVTLLKNGDIVFAYKHIPIAVQDINDKDHPVKVGISDAYLTDKIMFLVRRKTIYEYHRVSFKSYEITNGTILRLTALPTCLQYDTCVSCVNHKTEFDCVWCEAIQKCSSGTDRNKQDWVVRNCNKLPVTNETSCPAPAATTTSEQEVHPNTTDVHSYTTDTQSQWPHQQTVVTRVNADSGSAYTANGGAPMSAGVAAPSGSHSALGGAVAAFVAVALVASMAAWTLYAFKNPHTRSGQLLIKYRPSQWSWRRGEARYTAATIHM